MNTNFRRALLAAGLSLVCSGSLADNESLLNKNQLIGSWTETVTFPPGTRPPLTGLVIFHADKTLITSNQGAVDTSGSPLAVTSSDVGVWAHRRGRTYDYSSKALFSDLQGKLVGSLKVRGTVTVTRAGHEYEGNSIAEVLDPAGNLMFPPLPVINKGVRMKLERLP